MIFIYSRHILKRMWLREITSEMIEAAIAKPGLAQSGFRGRHLARKRFHDRILEVVFIDSGDRKILITAYWLEESEE